MREAYKRRSENRKSQEEIEAEELRKDTVFRLVKKLSDEGVARYGDQLGQILSDGKSYAYSINGNLIESGITQEQAIEKCAGDLVYGTQVLNQAPVRNFTDEARLEESKKLREFTDNYNKVLKQFFDGTLPRDGQFELGATPDALTMLGVEQLRVLLKSSVLYKAMEKHGLTEKELAQIPSSFYNPVMIFQSSDQSTNPDGMVVLTQIKDAQGKPVVIAMNLSRKGFQRKGQESLVINDIASIHSRRTPGQILEWIKQGLLLYSHKKRALAFGRFHRLQLPKTATISERSNNIIIDESPDVKPYNENNSDILNQGSRGAYNRATRVISLFGEADFSTVMHEVFHDYHHTLQDLDNKGLLDGTALKADMEVFNRHYNREDGSTDYERAAKDFELYLKNGETSVKGLEAIFAKIKRWLCDLYRTVPDYFEGKLDPEIKEVFDRMLASDTQAEEFLASDISVNLVDIIQKAANTGIVLPETLQMDAETARNVVSNMVDKDKAKKKAEVIRLAKDEAKARLAENDEFKEAHKLQKIVTDGGKLNRAI